MSWLEFLNRLENTLAEIDVRGKKNIDYMNLCFTAIDQARQSLFQMQQQANEEENVEAKEEAPTQVNGGDEDGRQVDR